jgi:uncharacterized protein YqgC (DUF456 family)
MIDSALEVLGIVLLLLGLVGIVLPLLPGILLSWVGFFLYAQASHFEQISFGATMIFLGLSLVTTFLDYALPLIGAKRYKASKSGLFGAGLGSFLGVMFFGPMGIVLGPFLGVLLGEIYDKKNILKAIKPAKATILGVLISVLAKIVLVLIMTGLVVAALIK